MYFFFLLQEPPPLIACTSSANCTNPPILQNHSPLTASMSRPLVQNCLQNNPVMPNRSPSIDNGVENNRIMQNNCFPLMNQPIDDNMVRMNLQLSFPRMLNDSS